MTDTPDIQQLLAGGLALHRASQFADAEANYRRVLAFIPDQPEALHLLGVICFQTKRPDEAVKLISRSVALAPNISSLTNLVAVLRSVGRSAEALPIFRQLIAVNSGNLEALLQLGSMLMEMNQLDDAEKCLSRAAQLAPQRADLFGQLCMLRQRQGDPHGAVLAGRRAVELMPQSAEYLSNLATALSSAKKDDEALAAAEKSVELAPNQPEAILNLGLVHERAGRIADAESAYRRAGALNPQHPLPYRALAGLFDKNGSPAEAIPPLRRYIELNPQDQDGWSNLSSLLRRTGDPRAGLEAADKALALGANHPTAHGNRGLALLALGDYERGFSEYEWRWRCDNFTTKSRDFDRPLFTGGDIAGRTLLIHCEQGFGDSIQFARYIPLLADRGAKVILESALPLRALLNRLPGVHRTILLGTKPPDFDLQAPLLSLPRVFGTTLDSVPNKVPYLTIDPERLASWRTRIGAAGAPGLKVGLIWAGNPLPDPGRTCPLKFLSPLRRSESATFFSLLRPEDIRKSMADADLPIVDLGKELSDFTDTGAAMMNLDLIITIDTAAAHLAGALGRPTWTLLPFASDWRWLSDRDDSPWYPTMRLFRQPAPGDWRSVTDRVAEQLAQFPVSSR